MRDFEENLHIKIRKAKSTRNEIIIFNKKIDFSNKIIDVSKKRKLYNVFVDINIENFINFFSKTFFLIFVKKLFSQFKIKFDKRNNAISVIV